LSNPFRSPARLSAFSVTGLVVVALFSLVIGLGFNKASTAQGTQPLEVTESAEPEKTALTGVVPKTPDNPLGLSEEVEKKFGEVGRAFRMVRTALAAYHVDHNQVPAHPYILTTPLAYLTKIPDDPFGTGLIHIVLGTKKDGDTVIFSVGPDGDFDDEKAINSADPFLDGDIAEIFNPVTGHVVPPADETIALVMYVNEKKAAKWKKAKDEKLARLRMMEEAKKEAEIEAGLSPEERIKRRVSEAKADLRSVHVAMESYHVDYETYPDVMLSLTTPIAYLSAYFHDPFADVKAEVADEGVAQPAPDPGPGYIKRAIAPDYSGIHLYSVGPDGIDQRGELVYDPTNGTISSGDIVRTIKLGRYYRIEDQGLRKNVRQQLDELNLLKSAVEAWYLEHRALPDSLEKLMAPVAFIKSVPEDLFVPGSPISYYLDKEQGVATIYSFGPDGDDDGGEKDLKGYIAKGEISDADIIVQISLSELEERFPRKVTKKVAEEDPMLKALLKLKDKDGRDNALIHYQLASKLWPGVPRGAQIDLIKQVLEQGWNEEANLLLPYIATFQPMFEEIRKGTALDYAMGVGWEQGPSTPVPNFLAAQISVKMLCVEGRYLESQGEYQKALDNYMTVLTIGRDFSAPEGTLISYLISVAIESISLKQIHHLVTSGHLDRTTLDYVLTRLSMIEETQGTSADAFRSEANCMGWIIKKMREKPDEIRKMTKDQPYFKGLSPEEMSALAVRLEAEHKRFWGFEIQHIETPYWERDPEAHKKQLEEMKASFHPLMKIAIPNFTEADVRALVTTSKLLETQIATALAACKIDKRKYPKRLSALVPDYFKVLPMDPFNGEEYRYKLAADGSGYVLYGVGPDSKDEATAVLYDPTNGTISGGDILFKK